MRILVALIALFLTAAAPPEPATVRVRLVTSAGNIVVALDGRRAPKTVANFLAYVDDGRLENTQFYRSARRKGNPSQGFVQGPIKVFLSRVGAAAHEALGMTADTKAKGAIGLVEDAGHFFQSRSEEHTSELQSH